MKKILQDSSFRLSLIVSSVFLATAILFLVMDLVDYGLTLFMVFPFVLGIAIGLLRNRRMAIYGTLTGTLASVLFMLAFQVEYFFCILMCLPLMVPVAWISFAIVRFFRDKKPGPGEQPIQVLLLPLLVFVVAVPIEHYSIGKGAALSEVRSEIVLPYTSLEVYHAIKSVDTLDAERTLLMSLGLPVPQKCVLEREAIGAARTCYFEGGTIEESVTRIEPGKVLAMDVTHTDLKGLEWLGFHEAIYTFGELGERECRLTRITTYTSQLKPRFYWAFIEQLGIEQEHEYVFRNLQKDLQGSSGN